MTKDLNIAPVRGTFDIDRMRAWLDARIDAFEDPHYKNQYFLVGVPSEKYLERRRDDDTVNGALLMLEATVVHVVQDTWAGADDLRSAMDFVAWLMTEYPCRIQVEGYGTDLTERMYRDGAESVYGHDIRDTPHRWDGKLVRVGFFWEIHDAGLDDFTISIHKARRSDPQPDEDRVARYLEAGRLYERHDEPATDYLTPIPHPEIGPSHLLTDGLYVWPADFAYYVRTYHVHVPLAFVKHAERNGWHVPEVDIATLPELAF